MRKNELDKSGALFDNIKEKKKFKRDQELAAFLGEHKSVISAIRNGKREINEILLVRICDKASISLKSARAQIAQSE